MLLESIESRLRAKIGLNADSLGPSAVEVAVRARAKANHLSGIADYVAVLDSDPQEMARLIEELVVLETWFFREPEAMRLVAARAKSALTAEPNRVFRVLSVPCATGEEPYSVVMALLDAGIAESRFRLDAVDVSMRALEIAERGAYGAKSFRGKDHAFRDRYFRPLDSYTYELDDRVRALVRFRHGNLVQANILATEKPYDAIFCRNVLIYLHAAARKTALTSLDRLLAEGGVLLAGHAEALESMGSAFVRAGKGAAFAYVRSAPAAPASALQKLAPRPAEHRLPKDRASTEEARAARAAAPREPLPHSLDTVIGLADRGELKAAAEQCENQIKSAGPSARAFCLLGVIRRAEGDLPSAEQCFSKALYLEPTHSEALLHLALIHESRGERASAERLRKRAERAARSGGAP